MKRELNNYELFGINICFQLLLRISQEFIHQRRILTKKEMKNLLARELPTLVGGNSLNIFLMPLILPFSYGRDLGDVSIMIIRTMIDFLISNVKSASNNNKNSKNNGEVD
jgi:hypothetical protein